MRLRLTKTKIILTLILCVLTIIVGAGIGSVYIPPADLLRIAAHKLFGVQLPPEISETFVPILWNVRLPRTLLAFLVGGALAVSGTVMQSVLKNPLASSFTLGVSSGASLGAGVVIIYGIYIPFLGMFTLPLIGLLCGMLTVVAAIALASRFDKNIENNTIILTGMIFSLFISAIMTLLSAMNREQAQRLLFWQMGSFSLKDWAHVQVLFPIVLIFILLTMRYSKELDILTFGEEQAKTVGVDVKKVKWLLLSVTAILTGSAIAMSGVIGFIDLAAPHFVRKLFGSKHKHTIPMSALIGGAFLVICDLVSRTVVPPIELPVGAVTALMGAPFFAYIYFRKRS